MLTVNKSSMPWTPTIALDQFCCLLVKRIDGVPLRAETCKRWFAVHAPLKRMVSASDVHIQERQLPININIPLVLNREAKSSFVELVQSSVKLG